ncbi:MAG: hypothetical protein IKU51_02485 [Clostridia bacterium]|nr:hypothetical protein [Clostridia bacterium]
MEKKNSYGWILIVLAAVAALVAAALLFVRTERRMLRLVGMLESHLPRKQKNQFTVEL